MGVESFLPEMVETWKKAALDRRLVVKFPVKKAATTFRHRMYKLRVELKQSKNPEHRAIYLQAAKLKMSIVEQDLPGGGAEYEVRFKVVDLGYVDQLKDAGVAEPETPSIGDPPPLDD